MKYAIFVLFIIISCSGVSFHNLELDKDKVYLLFRGTHTKEGIVIRSYNIGDENISHVGICLFVSGEFKVYNIVDKADSFEVLDLESFYAYENIEYGSVWEVLGVKNTEKLKNIIKDYADKDIRFDMSFSGNEDEYMYCSEFVVEVLRKLDSIKFKFAKHNKRLKPIHATMLGKDFLDYYPLDIFTHNPNLKKIFEYYF